MGSHKPRASLSPVLALAFLAGSLVLGQSVLLPNHEGTSGVGPTPLGVPDHNYPTTPLLAPSRTSPPTAAPAPTGSEPYAMAFDSSNGFLYVANYASGNVTVVNASSGTTVTSISVGLRPIALAVDPGNGMIYVANQGSNNISVINGSTNTVAWSIPDPFNGSSLGLEGVAVDGATGSIYVTAFWAGAAVLNASTGATEGTVALPAGGWDNAIVYDPGSRQMFVSVANYSEIVVINATTNQKVATLNNVSWGDSSMGTHGAVLGSNGVLFVAYGCNFSPPSYPWPGCVREINTTTDQVVGNISTNSYATAYNLSSAPTTLAYDGHTGYLYVLNPERDYLTVVNGSTGTPIGAEPIGPRTPLDEIFVPTLNRLFVSVAGGQTAGGVESFPGAVFPALFNETGLPDMEYWGVTINSSSVTNLSFPVGGVVAFALPNGTYNYTVNPLYGWVGYSAVPSDGNFTVGGGPVSMQVDFVAVAVYNVTVNETGLPTGSGWGLTVGNDPTANATSASSLLVRQRSGTVHVIIHASLGYGAERMAGPGVSPGQGSIVVSGSELLRIHFTPLETLYFNETNISRFEAFGGATWGVSLSPRLAGGPSPQENDTSGTSVSFVVPAGASYHFNVTSPGPEYRPLPAAGTLVVPHHSLTKTVKFRLLTEAIVFREYHLTSGQQWYVTISNGTSPAFNITTTEVAFAGHPIVFRLPLGTYSWASGCLAPSCGRAFPNTGQVNVTAAPSPAQVVGVVYD